MDQQKWNEPPVRGSESNQSSRTAPVQGSFEQVSPVNRSHSFSPRKKLPRRPQNRVHVQVNVTEAQMDKFAQSYILRSQGL